VGGTTGLAAALVVLTATLPLTDDAVRTEVDRLVAQVAAARHLPFHGTLPARAVPPDAAAREISSALSAGVVSSGIGTEEQILKHLGLIPASSDYVGLLAKAFAPAAAAGPYYDVTLRRLLVPDFIALDLQRLGLIHEIAHAIADQRFGIRRVLRIGPDGRRQLDGDAQRARLALVEGDADLVGFELVDPKEGFLGARELQALGGRLRAGMKEPGRSGSPWLAQLAGFTHVDGFLFVARVRARQPWSAVDALWADPPASSEQVLHPEKYDACEEPIHLDESLLPSLPGFGRPKATDVLGELVVRAWLATLLPAEIAERAAAGWGGDLAGLYPSAPGITPDGGPAPEPPLAWLTVWDDGAEAEDFARAAAAAGVHALARRGEAVALLLGVTDDAKPALGEMLDGWQLQNKRRRGGSPRRQAQPVCPRRDRAAAAR
jgi:hypothetical protein